MASCLIDGPVQAGIAICCVEEEPCCLCLVATCPTEGASRLDHCGVPETIRPHRGDVVCLGQLLLCQAHVPHLRQGCSRGQSETDRTWPTKQLACKILFPCSNGMEWRRSGTSPHQTFMHSYDEVRSELARSRKSQAMVQQPTRSLPVVACGRTFRQSLDRENLRCGGTGPLKEVNSGLKMQSRRSDTAGEEL